MSRLISVRFAAPLAVLVMLGVGLARTRADYSDDQLKADLKLFENAKLSHADKDLLQFIQSRLLAEKDRERIAGLIEKLSSKVYKEREQARLEVEKEGPPALPLLRKVLRNNVELEVKQRAERCVKAIEEKSPNTLVMAAARLLRHRRAPGAVPVLMEYVAIAPDEVVEEEIFASVYSLALVGAKLDVMSPAVKSGKLDPYLETALADKDPTRRAIAALVVARHGDAGQRKVVARLLTDSVPAVRFRAAQGLAIANDKSGLPVLVEMLAEGPMSFALQAEDLLSLIAQEKGPTEPLEDTKEVRQKCQTAWKDWWDKNKDTLDLSRIEVDAPFGGVAKRASAGAMRFFDAVIQLQAKGDFSMFAKTTDVPFNLAGQLIFKTRQELDDFIKMTVKGNQKDEGIPKFKIVKIVPAVEYIKAAPENERSFLESSRLAQVQIAYVTVQEGNNMDQEIGLPLFIRLSGGRAKCIGIGQPAGKN
jgi:HEAT repeat protein